MVISRCWCDCKLVTHSCQRSALQARHRAFDVGRVEMPRVLLSQLCSKVVNRAVEYRARRRMTGDAELTKSTTESLHYRNSGGRIYETRTPDGEPAAPLAAKHDHATLFSWNDGEDEKRGDAKGKGKAMTQLGNGGGHSAASSDASDEDDELLPSFGGEQEDNDDKYGHNKANKARKSSQSNSRISFGVNQNGFISRDDMLQRDNHDTHDRVGLDEDHHDNNSGKVKEIKPKRKRRKQKDRYNAGRFAREMAFVVSRSAIWSLSLFELHG